MTLVDRPALTRPRRAFLGGVCVGVARHLGWSVAATRVVAVALAFAGGAGILLYAWLWALVPLDPAGEDAAIRRRVPGAAIAAGIGAVGVAGASVVAATDQNALTVWLGVVILGTGTAVAWSLGLDRADPERSTAYGLGVRGSAVALLVLAGSIALLSRPSALNAVTGVGMIVLAVGVLAAPRVVALVSDLQEARAQRVRQEQRAEIAAHLHDSVLQTLALIQNRAGAGSEVARIARAQERELRDWLFAGEEAPVADLAAELRETAAAIELDFPVRIDVVAAGESVGSAPALVAAAREAMLNAARHAGGDVSVYVESSSGAVDVFVRDRGPGVDLTALPEDRLGIRESIIGRMARAGGSATVRPGAGGGTEVHLHLATGDES